MDPDAIADVDRVPHGGHDDPSVLDFSANVNPEQPPGIEQVYADALADATRYPDDDYPEYCRAAAACLDVGPDAITPTAGGLDAIRLALELAVEPGDSVLVPTPSFGEYAREVRLQGGDPAFVSHTDITNTDPTDHAVAIVCTPNNPTGDAYPAPALRAFAERCRAAETVLLVDEAFLDYTDRPSLAGEPGTIVARSLTKTFGIPGLRVGYAVATGDLGERLDRARRTWTLGTPAAAVGRHCLEQQAFVAETRRQVTRERDRVRERLSREFDVYPSEAPFLLIDVGDRSVDALLERARERGIVLRDARTFRGLDSHVRAAIRRPGENDRLLEALLGA